MPDAKTSWAERPLGDLLDIARQTVTPGTFPAEPFVHYSIPAWDETRGPVLEPGASIGSAKISITQPTLLVSKLNPRIPRVVLVDNPVGPRHCASTEFIPYVAKADCVSLEFFKWFLQSPLFQRRLERIATGSTNSHRRARPTETLGWRVPCPTPAEQCRITAVLDTVDEAIAKTEAVIAKLKRVCAGLLHDLLTRGLDEHGQLRDPVAHPEQFQDSPVGCIPREWEITNVEDAGTVRLGRQRSPAHETGQHMRPYLRVANVFDGFIDYSDVLSMNFEPAEQEIYALKPGDILLNEGQSLELVGRSAIFLGPSCVFCFQNTLVRFRCNATTIPEFCQAVFKYWLDTRRFTLVAKQTTSVAHLGADRFAKMPFPRPKVAEQERIAAVLRLQTVQKAVEDAALVKLQQLKAGLVTDLLTGRVRVPESLESG